MMLLYVLLTLVIGSLTWALTAASRHYRLRTYGGTRVIQGEQPDLFVGSARKMGLFKGIPLHRGILKYQKQFGDCFQYFLGPAHFILFSRPEQAQYLISHRNIYEQSQASTDLFSLMFPNTMICLSGDAHRRHARVILPMLKKARAMEFVPTISDATDLLLQQWERALQYQQQHGNDPDINKGLKHAQIPRHLAAVTLHLIGEIAYGEACPVIPATYNDLITGTTTHKKQNEPITTLAQATAYMVNRIGDIIISGLPPSFCSLLLKLDRNWQQSRKVIRSFIDSQIALSHDAEVTTAPQQVNLLQRLVGSLTKDEKDGNINDKNELTREEVMDELMLLIFGGYETSSTILSWFIVFVSKNPHVQQRIKDEIRQVIPKEEGTPAPLSQSQLDALDYMDCVVKETLRLAPTATFFGRMAVQDDVIDGIEIKVGQQIQVGTYNMHVDPRLWKVDPLKFDPDRFYGENAPDKDHHPYAFLPFGGGSHGCAGQELARVEVKAIMTRLMQRVTFHDTPENQVQEVQRITCVPENICVRVTFD